MHINKQKKKEKLMTKKTKQNSKMTKQKKQKKNKCIIYIYLKLLQAPSPTNMKGGWEVLIHAQGKL